MSYVYDPTQAPLLSTVDASRIQTNTSYYASLSLGRRFERLGSGQDLDLFGISVTRTTIKLQMRFVRKVYIIILLQSLSVTAMTTLFVHFLSRWHEDSYLWWFLLFPAGVFSVIVFWKLWTQYYQLSRVVRIVLLSIYCFLMVFILSDLAMLFQKYGVLVVIMSNLGITSVLLYTFQAKHEFHGTKPIFCCIATICIASIGLRELYQMNPVQILGPIAVASIVCTYFIFDLYYAMKVMTVDDYILAYISLYIDLMYPINCLHHLCEISDNVDNFPEYFNPNPLHE